MKMHTMVHAKFESKGKPKFNEQHEGEVREIILAYARWMSRAYMGSHLVVTIARTRAELEGATRNQSKLVDQNIMFELDAMIQQDQLDLEEDDEPSLLEDES